jgi:hypothetical protein
MPFQAMPTQAMTTQAMPFPINGPVANVAWNTSQIYMAAWAKSQYDHQMDRLFNPWYYEI